MDILHKLQCNDPNCKKCNPEPQLSPAFKKFEERILRPVPDLKHTCTVYYVDFHLRTLVKKEVVNE